MASTEPDVRLAFFFLLLSFFFFFRTLFAFTAFCELSRYWDHAGWKERKIWGRSPDFWPEKNSAGPIPEKSSFVNTFS